MPGTLTSGLLHSLFSLPGTLFSLITACLPPSPSVFYSDVTFSMGTSLATLLRTVAWCPQCTLPTFLTLFLSLLHISLIYHLWPPPQLESKPHEAKDFSMLCSPVYLSACLVQGRCLGNICWMIGLHFPKVKQNKALGISKLFSTIKMGYPF